jgi:hypothetical protein
MEAKKMTTNKNDLNSVIDEIAEVEEINQKQKRVLAQLLDLELTKENQHVVLKNEMGNINVDGVDKIVPSYVATHPLNWIGTNIKMGSKMPFMESKIDEDGRLIIDAENADDLQQRAPDWTRQAALTAYLIHDPARKFATILAVIAPPWVDDPNHENWGKDGKALKSSIEFKPLDSAGKMGVLNLNNASMYALDGQHRVMGVKGVQELQEGGITLKKKDGGETKKSYTRDEFLSALNSNITHLQSVLNEQIAIEYIPSVLAGETRREATQRVRSVFVAINSYAKAPDKGENILLDESSGHAIIARSIGVSHSLLKGGRVNWKNTSLPKKSLWYTTLQALKDMTINYLNEIAPEMADNWKPKFAGQVPIRPIEKELELVREKMNELLDNISRIPVFQDLEKGDDLTEMREFPTEDEPDRRGHLLVRPIGQTMLAKVVGRLVVQGFEMEEIFKKLNKFDSDGGFEAHRPESIFYRVTYNSDKENMITTSSNQEFAAKLLEYMVKGAEQPKRGALEKELAEYRTLDGNIKNFKGENTTSEKGLSLPTPIKL